MRARRARRRRRATAQHAALKPRPGGGKREERTQGSWSSRALVHATIAVLQTAVIVFILASCVLFGLAYVGLYIDDTAYHIPSAIRIAQHLNPYWVHSPVDSHWFPAGAETVVALLVLLTHSLDVTNLSGAACAIALVLLMYGFAGLWCRHRLGRLATAACVSTIPLLIGQSLAFYVDIDLALVVCGSLYLLCRALLRRDARDAYAGLAVALLAPAVKYSGILTFAVLGPAAALCIWQAAPPRRPGWKLALALAVAFLFTSGWYVRNWMERGNPVYPFAVPSWTRPILALNHVPFEFDPEHGIGSPRTTFPHPFIPQSWIRNAYEPDMTADAFGLSGAFAFACVVLASLLIRRQSPAQRRAWIFLWVVTGLLVVTFPYGFRIPRYLLCVPLLACLGPAVLYATAHAGAPRGAAARVAADLMCAGILLFSATYAAVNLVTPGLVANNLRVAWSHLVPYDPVGIRRYPYVERGHLRIGYTSGFDNFIAMLYDPGLTNTLIPLYYKNYPYNYWHEMRSPQQFIAHVRSLHLDYIHIFDPRYPGVDLLRQNFPNKIMPPDMRR